MRLKERINQFYLLFAEKDLAKMLMEMGYDDSKLLEIQKKRVNRFIIGLIISLCLSYFGLIWLAIGLGLIIYQWFSQYRSIQIPYRNHKFKKQFSFFKFARTLIPYLYQDNATVYSVLNRMLTRVGDNEIKENLERLIIEMNDNPNSSKPFENFALNASGEDEAVLFMHTLYDYQQHSYDKSIIQELGRMASDDLFKGVDEIIEFKIRKFNMFPTKLTMINILIVLGYLGATFINELQNLFAAF